MFLGSSIGNLALNDEVAFLKKLRESLGENDRILIGIDVMKDPEVIKKAYNDDQGVTEKFILNVLERIKRELSSDLELNNFRLDTKFIPSAKNETGKMKLRIKSLADQTFSINGKKFSLVKNEKIHIEDSHKFQRFEIDYLANSSGFRIENQWIDPEKMFTLNLFAPSDEKIDPSFFMTELQSSWSFVDFLFKQMLTPDALLERPIDLRHPFIFYVGHLTSFEKNQIFNNLLKRKSETQEFDSLFERGMDPLVEDPSICHSHSASSDHNEWPPIKKLEEYAKETRLMILESLMEVLNLKNVLMAQKGRVFTMVVEHTWMHLETLLYMIQVLDQKFKKSLSKEKLNYVCGKSDSTKNRMIKITAGKIKIGVDFHLSSWGWDNEFPAFEEFVEGFEIDELPVTNKEYISFIEKGEYDNPINWNPSDWEWKEKNKKKHPVSLQKSNSSWTVRTALGSFVPIENAEDWPVYCSLAEATAYANSRGKRIPTEAEYMRAAYGSPDKTESERKHPWGNEEAIPGIHGNFDFYSWAPCPVGSFPKGKSAWGVHELVGNGWEWTSTPFMGLPGFERTIPDYQGYSADFFDGHHFVMLGASWATAKKLVRKSFRNWFQRHYEFMFSKFRCVSSLKE